MEDDLFDFVEKTVCNKESSETEEIKNDKTECVEEENNEEMFKNISENNVQEMATKITFLKETVLKHIKELEDDNMRLKGELNNTIATFCPSCSQINGVYPKIERQVQGFIYVDGKTLRLKFDDSNDMKKFYYNNKLHLFDK
uniref:Uncharacterized protein n=1 Tax=Strongyloides stercoralis TaxID=6248 RepID=A0A0K0E9B4_STRER